MGGSNPLCPDLGCPELPCIFGGGLIAGNLRGERNPPYGSAKEATQRRGEAKTEEAVRDLLPAS